MNIAISVEHLDEIETVEIEEGIRLLMVQNQKLAAVALFAQALNAKTPFVLRTTLGFRNELIAYAQQRVLHLYRNHNDVFTGARPDPAHVDFLVQFLAKSDDFGVLLSDEMEALLANPKRAVSKHLRASLEKMANNGW